MNLDAKISVRFVYNMSNGVKRQRKKNGRQNIQILNMFLKI